MPLVTVGSATATRRGAPGLYGSASAASDSPAPAAGDGEAEATVDRRSFLAWAIGSGLPEYAGLYRVSRARVLIDGVDFSDSVIGGRAAVKETADTPVRYASWEMADARLAYHHPQSISRGALSVSVYFQVGPPGYTREWLAFRGTMVPPPNDEPFLPRASVTAESLSARYMDAVICVRLPAQAGYTRGALLREKADEIGLVLMGGFEGAVMTRALDFDGTFGELLQTFSRLERWQPREDPATGAVEILTAAELAAEDARFPISESDGVSDLLSGETPPSRPATRYVVTGTAVPGGSGGSSEEQTDGSGNVSTNSVTIVGDPFRGGGSIITRHRFNGLTYSFSRVDYALVGTFAVPQVVRRLSVILARPLLRTGGGQPDLHGARLSSRVTRETTYEWQSAIPTEHTVRLKTEEWTWDPTGCYPTSYDVVEDVSVTEGMVTTTTRTTAQEAWPIVSPGLTQRTLSVEVRTPAPLFGDILVSYTGIETHTLNALGDGYHRSATYALVEGEAEHPADDESEQSGLLPLPVFAAGAEDAAIEQEGFVLPIDVGGTGYLPRQEQFDEWAPFLESVDEARRLLLEMAREQLSVEYQISGLPLPFIAIGSTLSIQNHARSMDAPRYGSVVELERSVGGERGEGLAMVGRVRVPPAELRVIG